MSPYLLLPLRVKVDMGLLAMKGTAHPLDLQK